MAQPGYGETTPAQSMPHAFAWRGRIGRLTELVPETSTSLVIIIATMISMIVAGFVYISRQQEALSDIRETARQMRMARQAVMEGNTATLHAIAARDSQGDLYNYRRAMEHIDSHPKSYFPQAVSLNGNTVSGQEAVASVAKIWQETFTSLQGGKFDEAKALYESRGAPSAMAAIVDAYFNELAALEDNYRIVYDSISWAMKLTLILQILTGFFCIVTFLYAFRNSKIEAHGRALAVTNANETRHQVERLFDMADTLQSAFDYSDANSVLRSTAAELLAGHAGALYVFNNSRDRLVLSTTWNHPSPGSLPDTIGLSQCWALKRGKPQINRPNTHKLCCEHYNDNGEYLYELPMTARGEILGLLQIFDRGEGAEVRLAGLVDIATSLADAMSLALSNLALREKLRSQALRDPLTGLYNRRYMEDTIQRFVRLAERDGREVSVIMIDLDHFKRLNDQYGHAKGDSVLRDASAAIVNLLRETDVACRYGGEELIVLLPSCGLEMAAQKAENIRLSIEALSELDGAKVSASIGVSTIPASARAAKDLVESADAALYAAKQSGRNRVICAPLRPIAARAEDPAGTTIYEPQFAQLPETEMATAGGEAENEARTLEAAE